MEGGGLRAAMDAGEVQPWLGSDFGGEGAAGKKRMGVPCV